MTERSDKVLSISLAEPVEGLFVVSVVGDLDSANSAELSGRLATLTAGGPLRVVVDVSGLDFIDSSGLNVLVTGAEVIAATQGAMVVAGAPEHIARVFDIVRIAESVAVEPSVEQALRRLESDAGR